MNNDNIYVALNIGSAATTAMAVQRNEEGQLRILGVESGASEGVRYGEIINPSSMSAVVSRLLKLLQNRIGHDIGQVYIGLNGRSLKIRKTVIGRELTNGEEVTNELLHDIADEIKQSPIVDGKIFDVFTQEVKIDDEIEINPIGCLGNTLTVHYRIVVGKPEVHTNLLRCLDRTGYVVADTPIQLVATSNALLTHMEKEQGCALVDFGAHCTSLAVFHKGFLRYLAVIPLGGRNITRDIASLEIAENIAEELKTSYASAVSANINQAKRLTLKSEIPNVEPKRITLHQLSFVTEARAGEIIDAVWLHIEHSGLAGHLGAGIVITGNGAKLQDIDMLMQQRTRIPVRIGSHSLYLEDGTPQVFHDIAYSPLIGILLGADSDCLFKPEQIAEAATETPNKKAPKINRLKNKVGVIFESLFKDE
jgi:cell division protein FtsA